MAASGGKTGLGGICGSGCSTTSVSGTVAVIVATGGSFSVISSIAGVVTTSTVSSSFIYSNSNYNTRRYRIIQSAI